MTAGIEIARIYESSENGGGRRVLVDRLWPRGVSRAGANVDAWLKDIAPSNELRRWYAHDPGKWEAFKQRYFAELDARSEAVEELMAYVREASVLVLLYSSREKRYNNAVALKEYIESRSG